MISMTGMGRARGQLNGVPIRIEIKAVNHRFCDVCFRAPSKYAILEIPIQRLLKETLVRGRIDIFIHEEKSSTASSVDLEAYKNCLNYLKDIRSALELKDEISMDLVMSSASGWMTREINSDSAFDEVKPILLQAIDDLNHMRNAEGVRLKSFFRDYFATIRNLTTQIKLAATQIEVALNERLKLRLKEKQSEIGVVDEQRISQEIVFYLDRMSIAEELDRLDSHLKMAEGLLNERGDVGRKLDFLLQEFNREFNTIGSKIANSGVAQSVVEAKTILEKIREQIQNIV